MCLGLCACCIIKRDHSECVLLNVYVGIEGKSRVKFSSGKIHEARLRIKNFHKYSKYLNLCDHDILVQYECFISDAHISGYLPFKQKHSFVECVVHTLVFNLLVFSWFFPYRSRAFLQFSHCTIHMYRLYWIIEVFYSVAFPRLYCFRSTTPTPTQNIS